MKQTSTRRLLENANQASLSWHPERGGRRGWVCFEDDKTYNLGPDPSGNRFRQIADRMVYGNYYPADVITFNGTFVAESRPLRVGDRVLQQTPLFANLGGPTLSSAVEIFAVERAEDKCKVGYVTTAFHHGRGIWVAELMGKDGQLSIRVRSTAFPQSWLFWLGLPYARFLQLRARRRAIEAFRRL